MPTRCLIVDDSLAFGRVAEALLEQDGFDVVGLATCAADAVRLAAELRPDIALVDIDLGGESGFELSRLLDGLVGAVIMVSTHAEEEFAELIERSSATGFVAKSKLSGEAIEALLVKPRHDRGG
jgi:DNA-binding NarL/FixJ family response regulator